MTSGQEKIARAQIQKDYSLEAWYNLEKLQKTSWIAIIQKLKVMLMLGNYNIATDDYR